MKIAIVKRRYSLRWGGSERYCVNLARQLKCLGHEVTVIGETIDADLAGEVRFIKVKVHRLASWTKNRSFAIHAAAAARSGNFDVVYGLGRTLGADAIRVTESLQRPWMRVRYPQRIHRALQRLNPRHLTLIDLEHTIFHQSDVRRIVTQSCLDRQLLIDDYGVCPTKIQMIQNGVDTSLFRLDVREHNRHVRQQLGISSTTPLLLFASMHFGKKGLSSVLCALAACNVLGLHLLILGKGPIKPFRHQAIRLGLERRISFLGRVDDIQRYYGAADLAVLPAMYEPFPNVNLESMACGLPVLTTSTTGSVDIVEHLQNGYLVHDARATGQIVGCLEHYFSLTSEQREQMRNRCSDRVKTMTVARNAEETVRMFADVCEEPSSRSWLPDSRVSGPRRLARHLARSC